jgi:hypothetical protein
MGLRGAKHDDPPATTENKSSHFHGAAQRPAAADEPGKNLAARAYGSVSRPSPRARAAVHRQLEGAMTPDRLTRRSTMTLSRWVKSAVLAGGACLLLGGCTLSASTPPLRVAYQPAPAYAPEPVYYDGYVVHYDSVGPYIFVGRTPRYIPRNQVPRGQVPYSHPRYREVARNDRRHDGRRDGNYDGRRDGRYDGRRDGRHDRRPGHY